VCGRHPHETLTRSPHSHLQAARSAPRLASPARRQDPHAVPPRCTSLPSPLCCGAPSAASRRATFPHPAKLHSTFHRLSASPPPPKSLTFIQACDESPNPGSARPDLLPTRLDEPDPLVARPDTPDPSPTTKKAAPIAPGPSADRGVNRPEEGGGSVEE
jgi:hypothetical protein